MQTEINNSNIYRPDHCMRRAQLQNLNSLSITSLPSCYLGGTINHSLSPEMRAGTRHVLHLTFMLDPNSTPG